MISSKIGVVNKNQFVELRQDTNHEFVQIVEDVHHVFDESIVRGKRNKKKRKKREVRKTIKCKYKPGKRNHANFRYQKKGDIKTQGKRRMKGSKRVKCCCIVLDELLLGEIRVETKRSLIGDKAYSTSLVVRKTTTTFSDYRLKLVSRWLTTKRLCFPGHDKEHMVLVMHEDGSDKEWSKAAKNTVKKKMLWTNEKSYGFRHKHKKRKIIFAEEME